MNSLNPGFVDTPGNRFAIPAGAPSFDTAQSVEIPAEAAYQLTVADPKIFTARLADAKLLLEELGVTPSALV